MTLPEASWVTQKYQETFVVTKGVDAAGTEWASQWSPATDK